MHKNKNHPSYHFFVIMTGFSLIILVTVLFFAKNYFSNRKKDEISTIQIENEEKIKDLEKYLSVSSKELLKKINTKEKLTIIDIRDAKSFKKEHLLNSKNIPYDEFKSSLSTLNIEYNYIIVDTLGLTPPEMQVMDILLENNFKNITYLEGGIQAWKNELNPLISIGNPSSFLIKQK